MDHYEKMLSSNLGAGVQAFYRGPRLYDSEKTRAVVKSWVGWYKQYRDILESDIIHTSSRRADGRDIDWMLHANASLPQKGFLMVYNPLDETVERKIKLNVYYTGLDREAKVIGEDGKEKILQVDRDYNIYLNVSVPANGQTWYTLQ